MRQAYDYWQDQPGSIPSRRRRRTGPTGPRAATTSSRDGDGGRPMRAIHAGFGQTEARRAPPALLVFRIRELRRHPVARDARLRSGHEVAFGVRLAPHRFRPRGGRPAPRERGSLRRPNSFVKVRSTGNPRAAKAVRLRRRLTGAAREDVAAPAGIRPTRASPPLPTRRHDPHLLG